MALPPFAPQGGYLKTLIVFQNIVNTEVIKSIHVYRLEDMHEQVEEREFLFFNTRPYKETEVGRYFTAKRFNPHEHYAGRRFGVWECLLMYDCHSNPILNLRAIPDILSVTRNPKLGYLPRLFEDLRAVYRMGWTLQREVQGLRLGAGEEIPNNGLVPPE